MYPDDWSRKKIRKTIVIVILISKRDNSSLTIKHVYQKEEQKENGTAGIAVATFSKTCQHLVYIKLTSIPTIVTAPIPELHRWSLLAAIIRGIVREIESEYSKVCDEIIEFLREKAGTLLEVRGLL